MLFDTLDIPESLLAAQDDGTLVVFAGAGVSIGAPSILPSFAELAELIAQRPLTDLEKSRLDHFLGELKVEGRDVPALAVQALNRPGPRHTLLHEEIVRLFDRPTGSGQQALAQERSGIEPAWLVPPGLGECLGETAAGTCP
jgi:hypothetical protein